MPEIELQRSLSAEQNRGLAADLGATAVITHRVRGNRHADYELWLDKIVPLCQRAPGYLDGHIVRPVAGLTETYTVFLRFESNSDLQTWMESPARAGLIEEVRPLLMTDDDFFISSGLDFWFTPPGARAQVPVRWKQYLITWSAIFPLVSLVPFAAVPLLKYLGAPDNHLLTSLVVTGTVVFLMVYVVMPRYTKLVKSWLFK